MKKSIAIILGIVFACVMISGFFTAGLIIGNQFLPKNSFSPVLTEPVVDVPVFDQPIFTDEEKPVETDTEETEVQTTEPDEEIVVEPHENFDEIQVEVPPPSENLDLLFTPFWEAWEIVHEYYVEQPLDDGMLMEGAIQGLLDATRIYTDTSSVDVVGIDEYISQGETPEELREVFTPFWEIWALTHNISNQNLVYGAISGMLNSIGDPYTSYYAPVEYEKIIEFQEGREEYEGIGAWVDISKDYLTIITPFPDSPAEKAGLKPGDKVIAIDGEDMTGLDGELVRQKVLGPAGSTITITVLREGMKPFDVDVTRASVIVPSIESYIRDDNIAYLRIFNIGYQTDEDVREALEKLLAENPDGLILDMRYNGGGLVDSAINITSEFIEEGDVFHEIYGDGTRETHEVTGDGIAFDIPMVVLVNEGTASATEIITGALQDHGRAVLIGTQTFGKGLVQVQVPLSNDQGAVKVTTANWWTAFERKIHQIGLTPDIPIIGVSQAAIDEGFDINSLEMEPDQIIILSEEDIAEGLDVQLEKAVEVLLTK